MSYQERLDENLTLHSLRGEHDIDRFVAFNAQYNNEQEGRTCACFLRHQPGRTLDDAWMIEDTLSGEVVATVCLIPWTCRCAGVELRVAMLEMVLTHRSYRGRGLVRTLVNQFHRRVEELQCDLCLIWGIPYFYRQFGYAYAIDGDVRESLPVWRIPASAAACRLRPAERMDIPQLMALNEQLTSALDVQITRSEAQWEYLLQHAKHPVEMVVDRANEEVRGYATILRSAPQLEVLECSLPAIADAMALLQLFRETGALDIRIAWPKESTIIQLLRGLGSQTVAGSQWLLRIPDLARLLAQLAPVLEQRLAASPWRGLSEELVVNTYREAHMLCFENGRLIGIKALGFVDSSMGADGGHLCLPPAALVRLVFGYRTLDELTDAWPDTLVKPEKRTLFETLFPRLRSYLYAPYHYLGVEPAAAGEN